MGEEQPVVPQAESREAVADTSDPFGAPAELGDLESLLRNPSFNPEGKDPNSAERARLREMLAQFNLELADYRRTEVKQAIDNHVDSLIAAGMYQVPEPGEPVRTSNPSYSLALRSDGNRSYAVEYDPNAVPEIVGARATLNDLRTQFEKELKRYIASIPR